MAIEENKNTDFMSRLLTNVDPEARESLMRRSEPAEKKAPAAPAKEAAGTASEATEQKAPAKKAAPAKDSAMPDFLKKKKTAPGKKPVKRTAVKADVSEAAPEKKKATLEIDVKPAEKSTLSPKETLDKAFSDGDDAQEPVSAAFLEELASDMAVDEDGRYKIPTKRGHDKHLRFWFDPMSQKIWDGYADLIYRDELSVDNNAAHMLLLPFILERFEGKFLFRNELNLLPLDQAELLAADFRKAAKALKRKDMQNPAVALVAENITIDLLVPEEVYNEKYLSASPLEKRRAIRENLPAAAEFYDTVAAYLEEMLRRYRPKGFTSIAISAPV